MRDRPLQSPFGKKVERSLALDLNGMAGAMPRARASARLALTSYPLSASAARRCSRSHLSRLKKQMEAEEQAKAGDA